MIVLESEIPKGLINFSVVDGGSQGLVFSFNPK